MVISKKKVFTSIRSPISRCSLKKKKVSPRTDLVFPTFRPDFVITSKKHLQRIETVCAIFEGGRGNYLIRLTRYPPLILGLNCNYQRFLVKTYWKTFFIEIGRINFYNIFVQYQTIFY